MPKHNVYLSVPSKEIGNVDVHFDVYRDNEKLGQITISKGGIDYYPNRRKKPITLNWSQFDQLLRAHEREE